MPYLFGFLGFFQLTPAQEKPTSRGWFFFAYNPMSVRLQVINAKIPA